MKTTTAALALSLAAASGLANDLIAETLLVDFDDLAAAPSTYNDAPDSKPLNLEGVTLFGGVLLGTEHYGVADDAASQPNIYGTVHFEWSHSRTMTIDIHDPASSFATTLYNGLNRDLTFEVTAFDVQGNIVDSEAHRVISFRGDGSHRFTVGDATGPNVVDYVEITQVTDYETFWGFAIDDIEITTSVPAPGAAASLGLAGLLASRRRR
ncbi:MAG: hypothetical protein AAGI53_06275 [Planctomycetota bacterium]